MAGAHNKIKGYHTLKYNNVQHTNEVLNYFSSMETTTMKAVLTGPFTSTQNAKVRKASKVWLPEMKKALKWMKKNVTYYKDIVID